MTLEVFGSAVSAWPVIPGEWRVQSRDGGISRRLREMKFTRTAFAVCGSHLTVWKVPGDRNRVARLIKSLTTFQTGKSDRVTTDRKSRVRRFVGSVDAQTAKTNHGPATGQIQGRN
jgi:hypothetical protein